MGGKRVKILGMIGNPGTDCHNSSAAIVVDKGNKRGRPKEKDLTKEDWKQRYEILKKYQAFLKAQREKK